MELTKILKAIADETRFKIITLLLQHNYCVRALARKLNLSESAISQHIKVLKEAGLLTGVKKGYYIHYDVDREILHKLASKIKELADIERKVCRSENAECVTSDNKKSNHLKTSCNCLNKVKSFRHNDGKDV